MLRHTHLYCQGDKPGYRLEKNEISQRTIKNVEFLRVFCSLGTLGNLTSMLFHTPLVAETNAATEAPNSSLFLLLKDQSVVYFYFSSLSSDFSNNFIVCLDCGQKLLWGTAFQFYWCHTRDPKEVSSGCQCRSQEPCMSFHSQNSSLWSSSQSWGLL